MDAVQDVKSRLNIEDVIGEYVELKRMGRNFKGLSPFTNERTPSFVVSPEKNIWHDFSSGKGGDIFTFVQEVEGLDFRATLELLARKAGVDLEKYQTSRSGTSAKQKERLYAALDAATKFYQVHFSKNSAALEYIFTKRGFNKPTVLAFRLGYSPNNGNALLDYLKKQKFTSKEIAEAGLSSEGRYGQRDMFRGRIMVPLRDAQGRVIGFTARLLDDDVKAPKYINTPQTMLYDKSRHVYGLHLAKESIRKTQVAVMVEGNLDVIASHQAGVKNVIATAGTALTEMHLKTLHRFTSDVRAAFDQDRAGLEATERAIPIANKVGVNLSVITIPSGKDPDELITKDPSLWSKAIEQKQYALDWLIERYKSQLDVTSAVGKREFSDIIINVIRQLSDKVEQDHYLAVLAETIDVSKNALKEKMQSNPEVKKAKKPVKVAPVNITANTDYVKLQHQMLCLLLHHLSARALTNKLSPNMFSFEQARKVYEFIQKNPNFVLTSENTEKLEDLASYGKILALHHEALYNDLQETELPYEVAGLQNRLVSQYVKYQKNILTKALEDADESKTEAILKQVSELDHLLKS